MKILLIGNPENRRCHFFLEACRSLSLPIPKVISWESILSGAASKDFGDIDLIRIESPGENFEVERKLIELGGGPGNLELDHGRLYYQPEWYRGWSKLLNSLSEKIEKKSCFMNPPADISLMFDKWEAQKHLQNNDVPIPKLIGQVKSFEHLRELINDHQCQRLFLKPRHSSSASGVVAFQTDGRDRILATTSAEWIPESGQIYNSLRLRNYRDQDSVKGLVDTLATQNLFAERWFPKASFNGKAFDLRILVIAGQARHTVARTSASPITNLHLGNERGELSEIRKHIGEANWTKAMTNAEKAAACFPESHYVAVDLMIGTSLNRFAVAEVNAFGDLIPGIVSEGDDTYTAELRHFASRLTDAS